MESLPLGERQASIWDVIGKNSVHRRRFCLKVDSVKGDNEV